MAGFDMFKQCCQASAACSEVVRDLMKYGAFQVDATDNQLHKLSSFLPLAKTLTALYLSNNAITNIDCMRVFVNLETLDVSCNDIEVGVRCLHDEFRFSLVYCKRKRYCKVLEGWWR